LLEDLLVEDAQLGREAGAGGLPLHFPAFLFELADLEDEPVAGELLVHRYVEEELDPGPLVVAVGRHAGHDRRLTARRVAVRPGVADAAVDPDPVDTEGAALRGADRQLEADVSARLVDVAERGKPQAGGLVRKMLREELRQRHPDPIRKAEAHLPLVPPLAAERAVHEVVGLVLVGDGMVEEPSGNGVRGRWIGCEKRAGAGENQHSGKDGCCSPTSGTAKIPSGCRHGDNLSASQGRQI
jgi:hypothetical protein